MITDEDLDHIVSAIVNDFQNCGYKTMPGFLLARGRCVQQERIRESVHRVEPQGALLRALKLNTVNRKQNLSRVRSFRYKLKSFRDIIKVDSTHEESRFDSTQSSCSQPFRGLTGAKTAIPVSQ